MHVSSPDLLKKAEKIETKDLSIGLFDSGLGGLTVMEALSVTLPLEKLIYFGDTARVPYGGKSAETILKYSIENTILLLEKEIKCLVIACNTASSYALEKLQQIFKIPIIGVIDAAVKEALSSTKNGKIAILGTKATIHSEIYQRKLQENKEGIESLAIACPLLVPLAEENLHAHEVSFLLLKEYLKKAIEKEVDTLILGCTHYPLFQPLIEKIVGKEMTIINSGTACCNEVKALLNEKNLLTSQTISPFHYPMYVSDDPLHFQKTAQTFLKNEKATLLKDSLAFIQCQKSF